MDRQLTNGDDHENGRYSKGQCKTLTRVEAVNLTCKKTAKTANAMNTAQGCSLKQSL